MRWLANVCGIAFTALSFAAPVGWRWTLPTDVPPPPVPADNVMTAAKVSLGRRLFYEADLSINGTMSCATCHDQRQSFTDGAVTHPGVHGEPGRRNVPSLLNVAWLSPLTWADPRLERLEQHAPVPMMGDDPVEMGMKGAEKAIATRLGGDACYRTMFRAAFPESGGRIDVASVAMALAAFQRTFVSFDTPWDRQREGGPPLPVAARRGETLFFGKAGCVSCHIGVQFTDNRYHALGDEGSDDGLARVTGRASDRNMFRTPSLRNVALTAPYLHDGSAATVALALDRHGPGLTDDDKADLSVFLDQLTDRSFTANPAFALPARHCGRRA